MTNLHLRSPQDLKKLHTVLTARFPPLCWGKCQTRLEQQTPEKARSLHANYSPSFQWNPEVLMFPLENVSKNVIMTFLFSICYIYKNKSTIDYLVGRVSKNTPQRFFSGVFYVCLKFSFLPTIFAFFFKKKDNFSDKILHYKQHLSSLRR